MTSKSKLETLFLPMWLRPYPGMEDFLEACKTEGVAVVFEHQGEAYGALKISNGFKEHIKNPRISLGLL